MATSLLSFLYLHFQEAPASISEDKDAREEDKERKLLISVGMWP